MSNEVKESPPCLMLLGRPHCGMGHWRGSGGEWYRRYPNLVLLVVEKAFLGSEVSGNRVQALHQVHILLVSWDGQWRPRLPGGNSTSRKLDSCQESNIYHVGRGKNRERDPLDMRYLAHRLKSSEPKSEEPWALSRRQPPIDKKSEDQNSWLLPALVALYSILNISLIDPNLCQVGWWQWHCSWCIGLSPSHACLLYKQHL